ncbi:DNA mismatch repair protein Mlh1 [Monocercomonoides exilis]|uniref:DNA mismatch repair protein Mlh1 n=1 Tax=Monocercomonoides exilis TaxID=2049356 RepID=UPI00355A8036|nr:DNA mismatch repair protein Mlh1 [Monocercomonoides exilis]|eukprot:MONOS_10220.1-p1 / transcript=MONOS_10220.1 / gene=MONOS_10220 / organism=Monocercomonoides_exilis_PA203 / gene_product=DNA mismatch repair protein Mlh1 / transcript_product=DNA mismatch repair protein Mlh1 / location=Mono_scaffold00455:21681-25286(-) / protein_length=1202 / sequence_SO=supercontig / SO=protein_coding / is_pseudo=false
MSSRIHRLDQTTYNKIAAGEIIHRPANALKEMIENSLDAGATAVKVTLKDGGVKMLQIEDNGSGIHPDDFELVCERFATSKIARFEDLAGLQTFGFRGEALASISYVAKLTISSLAKGERVCYRASYVDGKIADNPARPRPCPGVQGTTIQVEDLFYNFVSRRRSLGTAAEELARCTEVVSHYAIHYPSVSFTLRKQGEAIPIVATQARHVQAPLQHAEPSEQNEQSDQKEQNEQRERQQKSDLSIFPIRSVYGMGVARELVAVHGGLDVPVRVCIDGYVSQPSYRGRRPLFVFFVNHRLVECVPLKKALDELYRHVFLVPKNSHPFVYLSLLFCEAGAVDHNVHPAKSEVRFLGEAEVVQETRRAVSVALRQTEKGKTFFGRVKADGAEREGAAEAENEAEARRGEGGDEELNGRRSESKDSFVERRREAEVRETQYTLDSSWRLQKEGEGEGEGGRVETEAEEGKIEFLSQNAGKRRLTLPSSGSYAVSSSSFAPKTPPVSPTSPAPPTLSPSMLSPASHRTHLLPSATSTPTAIHSTQLTETATPQIGSPHSRSLSPSSAYSPYRPFASPAAASRSSSTQKLAPSMTVREDPSQHHMSLTSFFPPLATHTPPLPSSAAGPVLSPPRQSAKSEEDSQRERKAFGSAQQGRSPSAPTAAESYTAGVTECASGDAESAIATSSYGHMSALEADAFLLASQTFGGSSDASLGEEGNSSLSLLWCLRRGVFVGFVDCVFGLMQSGTGLYLVNLRVLGQEMLFQSLIQNPLVWMEERKRREQGKMADGGEGTLEKEKIDEKERERSNSGGFRLSLLQLSPAVDVKAVLEMGFEVLETSAAGRMLLQMDEEEDRGNASTNESERKEEEKNEEVAEGELPGSEGRRKEEGKGRVMEEEEVRMICEAAADLLWKHRRFLERCFGMRIRRQSATADRRTKKEMDRADKGEECSSSCESSLHSSSSTQPRSNRILLHTLPQMAPRFVPDLSLLPLILLRLATEIDWDAVDRLGTDRSEHSQKVKCKGEGGSCEGNEKEMEEQGNDKQKEYKDEIEEEEEEEDDDDDEEEEEKEKRISNEINSNDQTSGKDKKEEDYGEKVELLGTVVQTIAGHLSGLFFIPCDTQAAQAAIQTASPTEVKDEAMNGNKNRGAEEVRESRVPPHWFRRQMSESFVPYLFRHLIPPMRFETDGTVVKLADLNTFYKVFERC